MSRGILIVTCVALGAVIGSIFTGQAHADVGSASGPNGRYQLVATGPGVGGIGSVYRIDTTTGLCWVTVPGTVKAPAWEAVPQPK